MNRYLKALVVVGIVILIVLVISLVVYPEWLKKPNGIWVLITTVFGGLLAFATYLRDLLEVIIEILKKIFGTANEEEIEKSLLELITTPWEKSDQGNNKVLHNLPNPDFKKFIGREETLKKMAQYLRSSSYTRVNSIVIKGIGGIGKSALALEVAHRYLHHANKLPKKERFDAVIWISAKRHILTATGIIPRTLVKKTLDEIYTTIANTLEREDIKRARPEDQCDFINTALTKQRILLIMDNLETIEDERVMSFLRELPPETQLIATSRNFVGLGTHIHLEGLSWNESQKLISQERKKQNITLTQKQVGRLYAYTGSLPLAMVWSIALIGAGHSIDNVLHRLQDVDSDIAKFCFEESVNTIINTPAYDLLLALSIFAIDASREALGFITGLTRYTRDEGLAKLVQLSLIQKSKNRFALLPLTKEYALSRANEDQEKFVHLQTKKAEYYLKALLELQSLREKGSEKGGEERLKFQKMEWTEILEIIDWWMNYEEKIDAEKIENFILKLLRHICGYLWSEGYWNLFETYIEDGIVFSKKARNEYFEAYFTSRLGRLFLMRLELDKAEKNYKHSRKIFKKKNAICRIAHDTSYLGLVYLNQNRFEDAENLLKNALNALPENDTGALKVISDNDYKIAKSRLLNVLGRVYLEQGDLALVEKPLEEAVLLRRGLGPSTSLAVSYQMMGRLRLKEEKNKEALNYLKKGQTIARQADLYFSGFISRWLAIAQYRLGKTKELKYFKN